ncbi:MAG: 3-hydroxyacyl-CoA dehydrogenase [Actinomycetaceae bacterium]|nr:3-hydroxyacyl-CoA dehydrogenase [Actinomycetaceae bacterium]MDY6082783.1 3-hydroxyacyl-CoA dehydrogenase [Actinomycetaceae bacterium]
MTDIKTIAVLGAGNLGAQIAFRTAYYGFPTLSYDINEQALEGARSRFKMIAENYVRDLDDATDDKVQAAQANITQTLSLQEVGEKADLVIEAVPERLDIKQSTYSKLAEYLKPEALVVSNSSTLLPSDMAKYTGRPEKFMNYHFANGIHKNNVVELMPHPGTADETYKAIEDLAPKMGMVPILLHKEQPGYVINTLLVPWLKAGQELWVKGIAPIDVIDSTAAAITRSEGGQFAPFRLLDYVGFGVVYALHSGTDNPIENEFARRLKADFIDKGLLGVETRHGFYLYDENGEPTGLSDEAKKAYPDFEG